MENNQAFVGRIGNIRPIEGADKIVKASVILNDIPVTEVIVGVDTPEGQEVVYFDSNLCLEKGTILSDYPELERYLGKNGRVKTIKLKGSYSDGLAVETEKFYKYFESEQQAKEWLEHGKSFNDIGGTPICHKYVILTKQGSSKSSKETRGKKRSSRLVEGQFHFHVDTDQLARNIHEIQPDDVISISRKFHGTSSIASRVLVKRKLSLMDRIAKFVGAKVREVEYDVLYSSRRVIKNEADNPSGFYSSDIWTEAGKTFAHRLKDGETAYFEILGYLPNGSWIQKGYDYGNPSGQYSIRLYRMTKTSPDGDVTEYSWPLLKDKAEYLGIPLVEEYYYGTARYLFPTIDVDHHWHENFLEALREFFLEKKVEENLTKKVPDEGIVLRVEDAHIRAYKLKSVSFLEHETKLYEKEGENIEDQA